MKANLQRYMMAVSLGLRFALALANGAAQHYPESPPAVSPAPPTAPSGAGATARATTDRGPESGSSGQVLGTARLRYPSGSPPAATAGLPSAFCSSIHTFGMRSGACCGSTPRPGPAGKRDCPRRRGLLELRAATAARDGPAAGAQLLELKPFG